MHDGTHNHGVQIPELNRYIESAGDASKRSRWVLLVLIVSSVFGYASYLSSRTEAWPWHRLELLNTTIRCIQKHDNPHIPCTRREVEAASAFLTRWQYTDTEAHTVDELARLDIDVNALDHHLLHQRDIIMDRIASQNVPILGFTFDVNDLGKIATMTFVILLLVLLLALRRERQNVELLRNRAIKIAGGSNTAALAEARDMIYMRQVFSIIADPNPKRRFFKRALLSIGSKLHIGIVWVPVWVEWKIFRMDLGTMGIGEALNSSSTTFLLAWELIGGGFSIVLALLATLEQWGLDKDFDRSKWEPAVSRI